MSDEPKIAAREPKLVRLKKGERYFWCTCGLAAEQPFCDGSHAGTSFRALKYVPEQDEEVFLCQCKYSSKKPFCDGSHTTAGMNKKDAE